MMTRRSLLAAAPAFLQKPRRPNILFAISDDQSWLHTGVNGDRVVKTPAFDRVAQGGIRFTNAISCSPGCAPSRAAVLTGRPPWQIEEAGTHASYFPKKLSVYPDLLKAAGYFTGLTGKGAGPCNFRAAGWPHNPAGPDFSEIRDPNTPEGVNKVDYAANFSAFLGKKPKDQPFCFWFGCHEPHRTYKKGSGLASGKRLEDVVVPPFLPDNREMRSDILDYLTEIEHFDRHLAKILAALEKAGELSNTLIVVTADNGMSFPRSKANMYEYGIHLPLALMWGDRVKSGQVREEPVSFLDYAPTFLAAAGVSTPANMLGRNLLEPARDRRFVLSGRERHSHARRDNLGYPARALRTAQHLYIRNFKPDRWPAGDPDLFADIDGGPSKDIVLAERGRFFELACGKRPAEELFDIRKDPGCLDNLAGKDAKTLAALRGELDKVLTAQQDPRMTGNGDIWESYPRHSPMRPQLGGFAEEGKYNPAYQPK
ncbi:MAG: sulfatase [Bryobacter sp.]|nr:sulfatase [Bryobacter sp.]